MTPPSALRSSATALPSGICKLEETHGGYKHCWGMGAWPRSDSICSGKTNCSTIRHRTRATRPDEEGMRHALFEIQAREKGDSRKGTPRNHARWTSLLIGERGACFSLLRYHEQAMFSSVHNLKPHICLAPIRLLTFAKLPDCCRLGSDKRAQNNERTGEKNAYEGDGESSS